MKRRYVETPEDSGEGQFVAKFIVPRFVLKDAEWWFYDLEDYFSNFEIVSDRDKVNHLKLGLKAKWIKMLRPIFNLYNLPNRYHVLKALLMKCSVSHNRLRMKRLLNYKVTGTACRPSEVYRKLRRMAPFSVPDEVIQQVWFQNYIEFYFIFQVERPANFKNLLDMADILWTLKELKRYTLLMRRRARQLEMDALYATGA